MPSSRSCLRLKGLGKVAVILFAAVAEHNELQVKSCNHLRKNRFMRSTVISSTVSSMADGPATLLALLRRVSYPDAFGTNF